MATDLDFTAGDGIRIQVEGLAKTMRALSKAGADAEDMRNLMHRLGTLVVRAANPPVRTGRLAGTVRAGKGKTKAVVRAGGARAPYAGVVHYGWPARAIGAQPFLVGALNRTRSDIFATLDDGLADLLKKADLK